MLAHLALAALLSGPATTAPGTTLTVTSARKVTDAFGRASCAITLAASNSSRHDITIVLAGSVAKDGSGTAAASRNFLPPGGGAAHVLLAGAPVRVVAVEYAGTCFASARYSFRLTANGKAVSLEHPAAGLPAVAANRLMLGDASAAFR